MKLKKAVKRTVSCFHRRSGDYLPSSCVCFTKGTKQKLDLNLAKSPIEAFIQITVKIACNNYAKIYKIIQIYRLNCNCAKCNYNEGPVKFSIKP